MRTHDEIISMIDRYMVTIHNSADSIKKHCPDESMAVNEIKKQLARIATCLNILRDEKEED